MDNESYMKIMNAINKSLNDLGYLLHWFPPVDTNTRTGLNGTQIRFECFECEAKEPSPLETINYLDDSNFILHADNHSATLRHKSSVIKNGDIIEFEGILDTAKKYPLEYRDRHKGPWHVTIMDMDKTTKTALDGEYLYSESYIYEDADGNIIPNRRVYKFKKFERKKEPTPPTPASRIYYYKYFDTNTDDYIVAEFPSASDKNAIKHFKFIIEDNTDKARWNMMELYSHYFGNYKRIIYSCDSDKPDYQKIDEINAKLRNMK